MVMGVLKHGVGWRSRLSDYFGIFHVTTSEENGRDQEYLVKVLLAAIIGLCKVASTALPSTCNCLPIISGFFGRGTMEYSYL